MSVSDTKVIQMGQIPQAPENAGGKECDFVFRQSSEIKTKKIAITQSRFMRGNMILVPGVLYLASAIYKNLETAT